MEQIRLGRWPSGNSIPIAVIDLEPEELERRYGWVFVEDSDDLDYLRYAALALSTGEQILLSRHRGAPNRGTEVYADSDSAVGRIRDRFLAEMGLGLEDLNWMQETQE